MIDKLNTTEIGDNFESKSLDIIRRVIEEEQLGQLSNCLRIFQKKEYYSVLRKKNIKFDLTIEVWPPGANRYVLIYIIECKDYEKRVPVSKIEDFHSKIQQVAGVNVKGIFISNSPLQEGGLNIAESVGMMVIQGESSSDYKIILHKTNKTNKNKIIESLPIIKTTFNEDILDKGVKYLEKIVDKKIIGVFNTIIDDSRVSYNIDRLSKENIEDLANIELNKINTRILSEGFILTCQKLIEYIQQEYDICFTKINERSNLLGTCCIKSNTIGINESIKGTNRELFLIGHEFGHYLLHQKLSIGQAIYDSFEDSIYNFRSGKHDLKNPKQWIEWQANFFSSSLVLSKIPFLMKLFKYQDDLGRTRGRIYLDDKINNINDFIELINNLSVRFKVSKTSIIYKLNELNYINDQSRLKSIGQIISEIKEEYFM